MHDQSENKALWLSEIWGFRPTAAAQTLLKHHRVACLCEVSPYSEQYSQSHPLYKSETLKEKSLLHVFLLSFSKSSPSKILSFQILTRIFSDYWIPEPGNAWSPMKCRCLQPKSSRLLCTVHVCWLLPASLLPSVKLCYCSICTVW